MILFMSRFLTAGVAGVFTLVLFLGTVPLARAVLPVALDGEELPSLAPMLEQVQPAIVNISTSNRGLGSGVIIDADDGLLLTNHHVIEGASQILVTTQDGRELEAEVIGSDEPSDVAVIRVEAEDLTAIPVGASRDLRVGDFVVAIGSPFGLSQTVTSGIVSALGRNRTGIAGYEDFIQTDASINPGNSGGALVNLRGELVGINTAIFSRSGGSLGIGFSIPVDMVMSLLGQLVEHGEVKRGLLGVRMQDLTPDLAEAFGIKGEKGAVVSEVIEGSAAEDIGILAGDVIVGFNGQDVDDSADLRNAVGLVRPGIEASIRYYRDGELLTGQVRIKDFDTLASNEEGIIRRLEGARFRNVRPDHPDVDSGVEVISIDQGSPADRSGLQKDDVIISINNQEVATLGDMKRLVAEASEGLLLVIIRDKRRLFHSIK